MKRTIGGQLQHQDHHDIAQIALTTRASSHGIKSSHSLWGRAGVSVPVVNGRGELLRNTRNGHQSSVVSSTKCK